MKTSRLLKGLYALGGVLVIGVFWFTTARPVVVLPRMRLAPGYALTNKSGQTISSEDQRGHYTLYSFAYTRCQAECDPIYAALQGIDSGLGERELNQEPESGAVQAPPLRFLTLTLDPDFDTPDRLAEYVLPFQPQFSEWVWVTGNETRMKTVIGGGFEVFYQANPEGGITFGPRYVLVDGWGIIRAEYKTLRLNPELVLRDLELLDKELQRSKGATRLAYEAAHFFACYPH